ncbi:hypothetical protein HK097_004354 [Rhizophlyctis rosea]|uniref:GAIN-B domain-containing protein n=1 Tax=Rhizophlyctis rosea TaxID=64517 RepID=A0AAD5SG21_9FUNG|nr:hypothetical protein HK097_004354 [Rhizophlyctis rosea]
MAPSTMELALGPPTPPSGKTSIKVNVTSGYGGAFLVNPEGATRINKVSFAIAGSRGPQSASYWKFQLGDAADGIKELKIAEPCPDITLTDDKFQTCTISLSKYPNLGVGPWTKIGFYCQNCIEVTYFADITVTIESLDDIAVYNGHSSLAKLWSPLTFNAKITYTWTGKPTGPAGTRNAVLRLDAAAQGGGLQYSIPSDYAGFNTLIFSYYVELSTTTTTTGIPATYPPSFSLQGDEAPSTSKISCTLMADNLWTICYTDLTTITGSMPWTLKIKSGSPNTGTVYVANVWLSSKLSADLQKAKTTLPSKSTEIWGTVAGGALQSTTVWDLYTGDGSPYNITEKITIPKGMTLTVMPGVTINFFQWGQILIEEGGFLDLKGSVDKPINVVYATKEMNYEAAIKVNWMDSWNPVLMVQAYNVIFKDFVNLVLKIDGGADVLIQNSLFTNNVKGVQHYNEKLTYKNVTFEGSSEIAFESSGSEYDTRYQRAVTQCTFKNNNVAYRGNGIVSYSEFSDNKIAVQGRPKANNNLFTGNFKAVEGQSVPAFYGNSFCNAPDEKDSMYYREVFEGGQGNLTGNYWGTTDPALIRPYIYDANYDDTYNYVLLDKLLSQKPGVGPKNTTTYECTPPAPREIVAVTRVNIMQDTTWTMANSPYVLSKVLVVHTGATLKIEPGVEIQIAKNKASLHVYGGLNLAGTKEQPVIFTNTTVEPLGGYSEGDLERMAVISIDDSPTSSQKQNMIIRHAKFSKLSAGIRGRNVDTVIEDTTFQEMTVVFPMLTHANVTRSRDFGINLSNNFWGTDDYPLIRGTIFDYYYDKTLPEVNVLPLLKESIVAFDRERYSCNPPAPRPNFLYDGPKVLVSNTTYSPTANPIIIDTPLLVSFGLSLTIQAGSIVRFEGTGTILMQGDFNVLGTKENPVQFEGTMDTTAITITGSINGNNGPAPEWAVNFAKFKGLGTGISIRPARYSLGTIANVTFERGGYGVINSGNSQLIIADCTFTDLEIGIKNTQTEQSRQIYIHKSTFKDNKGSAILVEAGRPYITTSDFVGNRIAVQSTTPGAYVDLVNSTLVSNTVAIEASHQAYIAGGNVCYNTFNVNVTGRVPAAVAFNGTWMGVPDSRLSLSSVSDGRSSGKEGYGYAYFTTEIATPNLEYTALNFDCLKPISYCRSDCSGHGIPDLNGKCACAYGWTGVDCGTCSYELVDNQCVRTAGFIGSDCPLCLAEGHYWCADARKCVGSNDAAGLAACPLATTSFAVCTPTTTVGVTKAHTDGDSLKIVFNADIPSSLIKVGNETSTTVPCNSVLKSTYSILDVPRLSGSQSTYSFSCILNGPRRTLTISPSAGYTLPFSPWSDSVVFADSFVKTLSLSTSSVKIEPPPADVPPKVSLAVWAPVFNQTQISACDDVYFGPDFQKFDYNLFKNLKGRYARNFTCTYGEGLLCPKEIRESWTPERSPLLKSSTSKLLTADGKETKVDITTSVANRYGQCTSATLSLQIVLSTRMAVSLPREVILSNAGYTTVTARVTKAGCSPGLSSLEYAWSWDSTIGTSGIITDGSNIRIHPSALGTSAGGWVNVAVTEKGTTNRASSRVWVIRQQLPLTALVKENGVVHEATADLTLTFDAHDPMGLSDPGKFDEISCKYFELAANDFKSCDSSIGGVLDGKSFTAASLDVYRSEFKLTFKAPTSGFPTGSYQWTARYTKDSRVIRAMWRLMIVKEGGLADKRIDLIYPRIGSFIPPSGSNWTDIIPVQRIALQAFPLGAENAYTWRLLGGGKTIATVEGPSVVFEEHDVAAFAGLEITVFAIKKELDDKVHTPPGRLFYIKYLTVAIPPNEANVIGLQYSCFGSPMLSDDADAESVRPGAWFRDLQTASHKVLMQKVNSEITDGQSYRAVIPMEPLFAKPADLELKEIFKNLAMYSGSHLMGSLLSAAANDLVWIWTQYYSTENKNEATGAMKDIAKIALAGGFHYLDCANAASLGIDIAAVDAAFFKERPYHTPWCTGGDKDEYYETIWGRRSVYYISFSDYYNLDPDFFDLRDATRRAEAATKILDLATPWVQNALKKQITSQYGVQHVLGVVRDVVQVLAYGGDAKIHAPQLAEAVRVLSVRATELASTSAEKTGTTVFQAQQPISAMLQDTFAFTVERFQNLTLKVAGVDEVLARATNSILSGVSTQVVIGDDPIVFATTSSYLTFARNVKVTQFEFGVDEYFSLAVPAIGQTDGANSASVPEAVVGRFMRRQSTEVLTSANDDSGGITTGTSTGVESGNANSTPVYVFKSQTLRPWTTGQSRYNAGYYTSQGDVRPPSESGDTFLAIYAHPGYGVFFKHPDGVSGYAKLQFWARKSYDVASPMVVYVANGYDRTGVLVEASISAACAGDLVEDSWNLCELDISVSLLGKTVRSIGFWNVGGDSDYNAGLLVAGVRLTDKRGSIALLPQPFGQALTYNAEYLTTKALEKATDGVIETRFQAFSSFVSSGAELESPIIGIGLYDTSGAAISVDMGTERILADTWAKKKVSDGAVCLATDYISWKKADCDGPALLTTIELGNGSSLFKYRCTCTKLAPVAIGKLVSTPTTTTTATSSTTTATSSTSSTTSATTTAVPTVNPCPTPPTRGKLELSGLSLSSDGVFRQSGTGQVRFSATIVGCTYSRVSVLWTIDGKNDDKYSTSLSYPLQLSNYKSGDHRVSASVIFYDADNTPIAKLEGSTSFLVHASPLVAKLVPGERNVPLSLDLVIDATPSFDEMDPCYVASYAGSPALKKCLTANSVSTYNTSATPITFTFRCVDQTKGVACPFKGIDGASSKEDGLYIVTYSPYLTIPKASLVEGTFTFSILLHRDARTAGPAEPVRIKVVDTQTYVTIQKLEVQGATFDTTFVATKKIQIQGRVSMNSKTPKYSWQLLKATGEAIALSDTKMFWMDKATLTITGALADGVYIASLTITDENSNTATSSATFTIITTLQPPTGCTITPDIGTELATSFAASCMGSLTLGAYRYSYDDGTNETALKFPGSARETFYLPAGSAKNSYKGTVRVRAYIISTLIQSTSVDLAVTVNPMVTTSDKIGETFSNLMTSGSGDGGATIAAAANSFSKKMDTLTEEEKKSATGQVITAVAGTIDATKETTDSASAKIGAISTIASSGKLTEESKEVARTGVYSLATVLSNGAPGTVIEQAASAALATTPETKTPDSGEKQAETFNLLGQGLGANLSPGETASISTGNTKLTVSSSTPETLYATTSNPTRKRRSAPTTCDITYKEALQPPFQSLSPDAQILIQTACIETNPYPLSTIQTTTSSSILSPYLVTLSLTVDSQPYTPSTALTSPIIVTIPTKYTPIANRKKRRATETTYEAECVVWDSGKKDWSSDGCVTVNNSTETESVECRCGRMGSYSIVVKSGTRAVQDNSGGTSGAGMVRVDLAVVVAAVWVGLVGVWV